MPNNTIEIYLFGQCYITIDRRLEYYKTIFGQIDYAKLYEDEARKFESMSNYEIVKNLELLKREYDKLFQFIFGQKKQNNKLNLLKTPSEEKVLAFGDELKKTNFNEDKFDIDKYNSNIDKLNWLAFRRQCLTNMYALNNGADSKTIFIISHKDTTVFRKYFAIKGFWPDNFTTEELLSLNNKTELLALSEKAESLQDKIVMTIKDMQKSGTMPPFGFSNALDWDNEGFGLLPLKKGIKPEVKKELVLKMHEQVSERGNKASAVYNTILAAYCAGCFYDDEDIPFPPIEAEFDNIKLLKSKFSEIVRPEIRGWEEIKENRQIIKKGFVGLRNLIDNRGWRLSQISEDKPYYRQAVELFEIIEKGTKGNY